MLISDAKKRLRKSINSANSTDKQVGQGVIVLSSPNQLRRQHGPTSARCNHKNKRQTSPCGGDKQRTHSSATDDDLMRSIVVAVKPQCASQKGAYTATVRRPTPSFSRVEGPQHTTVGWCRATRLHIATGGRRQAG